MPSRRKSSKNWGETVKRKNYYLHVRKANDGDIKVKSARTSKQLYGNRINHTVHPKKQRNKRRSDKRREARALAKYQKEMSLTKEQYREPKESEVKTLCRECLEAVEHMSDKDFNEQDYLKISNNLMKIHALADQNLISQESSRRRRRDALPVDSRAARFHFNPHFVYFNADDY